MKSLTSRAEVLTSLTGLIAMALLAAPKATFAASTVASASPVAATFAAQAAGGSVTPGQLNSQGFVHPALVPNLTFYTSTVERTGWDTQNKLACDFDLVVGSDKGGDDGGNPQTDRPPHSGSFTIDGDDGFAYKVSSGYGIVNGRAPLFRAKRIRTSSDGTGVAIEIFTREDEQHGTVTVERVYYMVGTIDPSTSNVHPVKIRLYEDETQEVIADEIELPQPGSFYEVVWAGNNAPISKQEYSLNDSGKNDATYFATQMYLLLTDTNVFPKKEQAVAAAAPEAAGQREGFKLLTIKPGQIAVPNTESLLNRLSARFPGRELVIAQPQPAAAAPANKAPAKRPAPTP